MSEQLLEGIKTAMRPLADRFGLRVKREENERNYAEVLYVNETTGLSVAIDWSEFRPFLRLFELDEGRIPTEPLSYETSERLAAFDADDLLALRVGTNSPVGKMLGERDATAAKRLLSEYASALERNAADVFEGDFTVFGQLDRIVKARARDIKARRG